MAVADSVMLYLLHDFYNIICKIKPKLYIASGSFLPPPPPPRKNSGCAPDCQYCTNGLSVSYEHPSNVDYQRPSNRLDVHFQHSSNEPYVILVTDHASLIINHLGTNRTSIISALLSDLQTRPELLPTCRLSYHVF
jgi:hypothetical protein